MESRMGKYHDVDIEEFQRSKKNAKLYKEVYGNYDDLEDLPITENINEINLENLKSLVESRASTKIESEDNNDFDGSLENEILKEEKSYDINELLEKAKEENSKIKKDISINRNIPNYLASLESDKSTVDIISKYDGNIDDDLPIVKEVIFSASKTNTQNNDESNLSLEILTDLKPTGNTIVSEPIVSGIDNTKEEKEFFSGKVDFSNKDFDMDNDMFEDDKGSYSFIKILLFIIGISLLLTAVFFIVKEYTNIF